MELLITYYDSVPFQGDKVGLIPDLQFRLDRQHHHHTEGETELRQIKAAAFQIEERVAPWSRRVGVEALLRRVVIEGHSAMHFQGGLR